MLEFLPSREEFAKLSRRANDIPIYCSLLSDQLTPVSAFEQLAAHEDFAFLLESVVGGEQIARYSFLGVSPIARVEAKDQQTTVYQSNGKQSFNQVDPLEKLESLLDQYQACSPEGLPRFLGGAVGYAGYDIIRHYEKLGPPRPDDLELPDVQFGIYDQMVIFDHVRKLVIVVAHAHLEDGVDLNVSYDTTCARIESLVEKISDITPGALKPLTLEKPVELEYDSNITQEQFEQCVEKCQEYIKAGDIFQVVISQRLTSITHAAPFDIYRALRVVNPSPFMFYLKTPSVILVGASPEILCRIEGNTVSTRPLAGTRPRGKTISEDRGLEAELLADPKERAEHVMLVDLGRNDLGRVCKYGSVQIDDLMSVERYSHVMHICSNVSGTLKDGLTAFDVLRSVLPVGTVSGAPKIRAMQIIDELETVRRGPYAGAVGYIDFAGNMDTCITLRTLVITPKDDGTWRVDAQVGAGIVADSEPSREYQETINKAQSMLSALRIANAWANTTKP